MGDISSDELVIAASHCEISFGIESQRSDADHVKGTCVWMKHTF